MTIWDESCYFKVIFLRPRFTLCLDNYCTQTMSLPFWNVIKQEKISLWSGFYESVYYMTNSLKISRTTPIKLV